MKNTIKERTHNEAHDEEQELANKNMMESTIKEGIQSRGTQGERQNDREENTSIDEKRSRTYSREKND